MKKQITAIIPTFSNTSGLKEIFTWLVNNECSVVVVVDNSPSAEKRRFFYKKKLTYLPQKKNLGFATAVNLGAKSARTDWIIILNDDVKFLANNTLQKLIKIANKNGWSAISPTLKSVSGEIENLGYTILPHGKVKLNYDPQFKEIDGITAACLLFKRDVYKKLGGFNDSLFAYLEDVDLFLRLKKAGYKFGIAQDIDVVHKHMTTSSKMNNFKQKMDFRNWFFLIISNWDSKTLIKNLFPIILERFRNLSGYLKVTFRQYLWRSIYIVPKDLFLISVDILYFIFKRFVLKL